MEHIYLRSGKPDVVEAFASGVTHDFKDLLDAIKDRASIMMSSINPSDKLYSHVIEIINCIDKGSDIANKLLGFVKVGEYYKSTIDVNRLVRNSMENIQLSGRNITLDIDLNSNPLMVEADPEKSTRLLKMLLKMQCIPRLKEGN
jgi:signal transduction histidine kinase